MGFALRALVAGATAERRQAMTVVYVSFTLRPKRFVAHRDALPEISASSLPELRALLAEAHGGAAVRLHLSRRARAEVARRRNASLWRSGGRELCRAESVTPAREGILKRVTHSF